MPHAAICPDTSTETNITEKFTFITLHEDDIGRRFDKVLKSWYPSLQQKDIEKSLRAKMIRVNMQKQTSDYRMQAGDVVRVPAFFAVNYPQDAKAKPQNFDLKEYILFEDVDMILLNKPHGIPVQGGSHHHQHVDMWLDTLPKRNDFRPSCVHRLDKDTSGCLLIAKKRSIAAALGEQIRNRKVQKYYLALVAGIPFHPMGTIKNPLKKSEIRTQNELMHLANFDDEEALSAHTEYLVIDKNPESNLALVLFKPITGRTHQLRVHSLVVSKGMIGDPKYAVHTLDVLKDEKLDAKLCLHAYKLDITHPTTEKSISWTASLPEHMHEIMKHYNLSLKGYVHSEALDMLNCLKKKIEL